VRRVIIVIATALLTSACDFSSAQDRNLAQERACGNQAARIFDKEWGALKEMLKEMLSVAWESHYNSNLNRCLIFITYMSPATKDIPDHYRSGVVVDADSRLILAEYYGRYPLKENDLPMCVLNDKGFMCRTFDEFKELVTAHFGFDR